jgi:serine/threonine-protein kinase HipA
LAYGSTKSPVGQLNLTRNDGCEFRLLESYRNAYPRPILGQQFVDDPDHVHSSRQRTPPWFSNLLPEGPLRELIARQAGVSVYREFFLLQHLGEDLPGAVRIVAAEAFPETAGADACRRPTNTRARTTGISRWQACNSSFRPCAQDVE